MTLCYIRKVVEKHIRGSDMEELRVYTVREAAAKLKVSESLVRQLARSGKLQCIKVGRSWRFTQTAIAAYLGGK